MAKLDPSLLFEGLPTSPHAGSYELFVRIEKAISLRSESDLSEACGVLAAYYEAVGFQVPKPLSPRGLTGVSNESVDEVIDRTRSHWLLQFEAYRMQVMVNNQHANKAATKEAIESSLQNSVGYAILTPEEKTECSRHIEKIREIIESSELDDRKKNNLFDHLSTLGREIARNGTKTDRFFAFASDAAFVMGDFAKKAEPLFSEIKDILKIVTKARARKEGNQLPPGEEVLQLPAPASE